MKKITLFLVCLVFAGVNVLWAQNVQVSGVVTDANGPAVGVSVVVKGARTNATTDAAGRYSISAPSNAVLVFSMMGFTTQEIPVDGKKTIDVVLREEAVTLDDVIVVAYGPAKKESFVGSAGVVSAKKIEMRTVGNVTKALEGTVAGLQSTTGSGQPGSGSSIVVRGFGSIGSSNTPLYVVDGAPYDGSIAAINPADIESITILKDASAGALYGARGANGVVLVTTKKGKEGKALVTFKGTWGVASRAIPRYETMDERGFIEANFMMEKNRAIYVNGVDPSVAGAAALQGLINGSNKIFGANEQYNPFNVPVARLIDPETGKVDPNAKLLYHQDWLDETMNEAPLRQEYLATISGGEKKCQYYLSLGYLNEEGLLKTTSFDRISARSNITSQVNEWLKVGANLGFSYTSTDSKTTDGASNSSNAWYSAQNMGPIYPIYEMDANYNPKIAPDGKKVLDYGPNRPAGADPNKNVLGMIQDDANYSNADNLSARGFAEAALKDDKYGVFKGLSFMLSYSFDNVNNRGTTYYNPYIGTAQATHGALYKSSTRTFSYTFNQLIGYNRTFNENHTIDVLLGHEFYSYKYNYLTAGKTGFPFAHLYELNPGSTLDAADSYENNYRIDSYLSRVKYSYSDKYNFEASFRTDGSSRFYKDSRWGLFWSLGANWRISREEFMKSFEWLNNLSLRASYGVQGNDNVNTFYAWQSFYDLGWANANNNGAAVSSLENRDLRWEKNANFNIGLETRLLDRFDITMEYFHRTTSDMLLPIPMATSLGFNSYLANIGNMVNQGFEFSIGIDVIKMENFDWRFNVIGSTIKNKITKLITEQPIIDGNRIFKVGEPVNSWWLPISAGVDPSTGSQLYKVWDNYDPITYERTSEPYITSSTAKTSSARVVSGNKMPDFYGSIGSEFRIFKYFDFSFMTAYSLGGVTLDGMYNTYTNPLYPGTTIHQDIMKSWQKPGDMTPYPRAQINNSQVVMTNSNLVSASYFAIRNITLGFSLPKAWIEKAGISKARIFVVGDNLYTFSALKGFDPQASLTGSLTYNYVPVRTVSVGLDLSF